MRKMKLETEVQTQLTVSPSHLSNVTSYDVREVPAEDNADSSTIQQAPFVYTFTVLVVDFN